MTTPDTLLASNFFTKPFLYGADGLWWYIVMAFLIALPCSQLGCFLLLRRMALVGDAISHSVLPGIVIAFLLVRDLSSPWLLIGAGITGMLVTFLIEIIHTKTRTKQDAAIGIAFTSLFALGLLLVGIYARNAHISADCVIYGELTGILHYENVALLGLEIPKPVVNSGIVALLTLSVITVFYRLLMLSSFDAGITASFGINPKYVHYLLMAILSFVVVTSFQSVGAVLVIALLIIPPAAAYLCTHKLKLMLLLSGIFSTLSSPMAFYFYVYVNCSFAAAMVVSCVSIFLVCWFIGPVDGLLWRWKRRYLLSATYDLSDTSEE